MKKDVACVILVNKEGKILLQHRDRDAEILANHWGFFGGRVEGKETADETVKRELYEELNIFLKNPKLIYIQDLLSQTFKDAVYKGFKYIFLEQWDESQELTLKDGQGMEWLNINDAKKKKISTHDRLVLDQIASYL